MKIVYISGNLLFKCDENDSITKVDGTNIMIYTKTCYYTNNNQLCNVSHCINYPGSIQKMDNSTGSTMEFVMTAQLNGPTLKYKILFDINVVFEKINDNNSKGLIDWDNKVKQDTIQFIENIPYNAGVHHMYFLNY
jgi:hypothetical protein